jgi:predicted dehydrogenase
MSVRVGFLGAGLIATYHSKSLRHSGADAVWTGVHDPDRARAEAFARASGAPLCSSEEEVLDGCDAVYICTWTSEHPRLVDAAVERGLAVFCEKPLATDVAGARAMAAAVEQAQVVNQVGLVLRHSPAFNLLRHLAADPASGRVMSVVFRDDQFIPVQGHYGSTWRGDVALAGSGTLLEHSIHDIDMLEYVVGQIDSVSARSAEFHGITGIEDSVAVTLSFENGAVGSLVSIWHDLLERPSLRRVEVFCERAYLVVEGDWFGPVTWTRSGADEGSLAGEALAAEVARLGLPGGNPDGAFVECVAAGRPAHPDFATAVRAHEVADAIYRAAADERSVRTTGT